MAEPVIGIVGMRTPNPSGLSHPIPAGAFPLDAKRNFGHMSVVKTAGSRKVAALCH